MDSFLTEQRDKIRKRIFVYKLKRTGLEKLKLLGTNFLRINLIQMLAMLTFLVKFWSTFIDENP